MELPVQREYAFGNCEGLTSVTVNWVTPLDISANVFEGVTIKNIQLIVLEGTEHSYRAAAVWQDFDLSALSLLDFNIAKVRLYPNPTSSILKIDLNGSSEPKKAKIYNNLSQLILEKNKTQISVSDYSKGLYFAIIETTKGKVTKRFLVE